MTENSIFNRKLEKRKFKLLVVRTDRTDEITKLFFFNLNFYQQVAGFSSFPNANLPNERLVCQNASFPICQKLAKANGSQYVICPEYLFWVFFSSIIEPDNKYMFFSLTIHTSFSLIWQKSALRKTKRLVWSFLPYVGSVHIIS